MSDKTGIQWTNATWNPSIGCRRVSEGCRNCYAETQASRIVAMERGNDRRSPYEDVVKFVACDTCDSGYHADSRFGSGACPDCKGSGNIPRPLWNGRAVFLPERLDQPLRWTKPRRVFVNSMSDLFHEDLSFDEIAAVFGVMAAAARHTFQVLTKRPARALEFFEWLRSHGASVGGYAVMGIAPSTVCVRYARDYTEHSGVAKDCHQWPLPNVWLGISAEDQATADERIPLLLQCPAAVRFVSAEPLLGPIDLRNEAMVGGEDRDWLTGENYGRDADGAPCPRSAAPSLSWLIVGGESGPGARLCDVAWIRSIVEQCNSAGVACFVKQLGDCVIESGHTYRSARSGVTTGTAYHPRGEFGRKGGDIDLWPEDLRVRQFPEAPHAE